MIDSEKWAYPSLSLFIFGLWIKEYNPYNNVRNVHPVSGAGIRIQIHNFLIISLLT